MNWNWKEFNKQKHQFRNYYCAGCKQTKSCQLLDQLECCACAYQKEQTKAQEYSDYQLVYQNKKQEKKEYDKQLELLKNYQGCWDCKSKEVDAYELYENSQLICQPCRMKKEGGSSSPISFLEQQKWYKRFWGIDLEEWLEKYQRLPVNKKCAEEWLKERSTVAFSDEKDGDSNHLNSCSCLEKEAKELVESFTSSLKRNQEKSRECKCELSNKPRTSYYDSANYGYTYCGKCEVEVKGAGKMGVIKNRNNPRFGD